jgi:hypothetical protein
MKEAQLKYPDRSIYWECVDDVRDLTAQERRKQFADRRCCSSGRTQLVIAPSGKVVTCDRRRSRLSLSAEIAGTNQLNKYGIPNSSGNGMNLRGKNSRAQSAMIAQTSLIAFTEGDTVGSTH